MRDSIHNDSYLVAIPPVVVADNTAQVGAWIDRSGAQSLAFTILTGALADADATFAVLIEDADAADQSDHAAVDDAYLTSATEGTAAETAAAFTHANGNSTRKIGYIGSKQFVRITITPAANSGNAALAAVAKLGNLSVRPV